MKEINTILFTVNIIICVVLGITGKKENRILHIHALMGWLCALINII